MPKLPVKSVVRLGSTTDLSDTITNGGKRIEINTIQAIKNSANKLLMKQCFDKLEVKTAKWQTLNDFLKEPKIEAPYVVKHIFGSRGRGNYLFQDIEQVKKFIFNREPSKYIIEHFYNYSLEFRLHVDYQGCFYTCRKAMKENTPEQDRWKFNNETCSWYLEENDKFYKPNSWEEIEKECIKALESLGLDICAFDVRVQSSKSKKGNNRDFQDFIIVEGNSAPSLGDITAQKYLEKIPELIMKKVKY